MRDDERNQRLSVDVDEGAIGKEATRVAFIGQLASGSTCVKAT